MVGKTFSCEGKLGVGGVSGVGCRVGRRIGMLGLMFCWLD